jgi:hypothetical protein
VNVSVLLASKSVILEMPVLPGSAESPRLSGLILSLVRASGTYEGGTLELAASSIPLPFAGDTWRAEWLGKPGGVLRLGIPDELFAASFDPVARISVEALDAVSGAVLGALAVTVIPPFHRPDGEADFPAWLPPELASTQLGL